ncbi:Uncharacterised protein [Mycolicibacterium vanbaalenii]|uniref:Uncharacterized protein n=1 Tax=Mycolicibacterium vanbaalenii TaxID=110539 RepID=A0A5S9R4G4_MYCVN|nr:hypothetical protein [Mycolicibacterium vanbaalenii]CAA0129968.1 Uncharacterised protein [Mycolicibacterium vanbaalenii]
MRPLPSELIAGIRKILADTIAPELSSDHTRARLAEIRAVLAQIDWDDGAFALKSQAAALAACLTESGSWVPEALPQPPATETLAGYVEYRDRLGAVAIDVMDRLRTHLDEHPEDLEAQARLQRLIDVV